MDRHAPIAATGLSARYVIMSNGPLNRPKLPGLPGIDNFKGHTFHTSRWDYNYTGGDTTGNLHKLADKRVAIIGTGATAIQCVPHVGKAAKHLYVFQRTPSSVDERRNQSDRSRVGQVAERRMAARADGQLQHAGHRRSRPRSIW